MPAEPRHRCRYTTEHGWLTPEHHRDCNDHECQGCKPCPKTHCAMRGTCANHIQPCRCILTCPRCIGRVRDNLTKIEQRATELTAQAIIHGVDSEAFNLDGPAASPEQLAARKAAGAQITEDPHHPYAVLARWEWMLREDYGHYTDKFSTISRSRDYLNGQLDRLAHDDSHDFQMFDSDISRCLIHLEAVLNDSRAPERGAPCPKCEANGIEHPAKLVKTWAKRVSDDRWTCPACGEILTEADYRYRVGVNYRRHATRLTASDLHAEYGIRPGTIRQWALRGKVAKRGLDGDGRQLYDVQQSLAARDVPSVKESA